MRVLRKEGRCERFSAMPYCASPGDNIPPARPDSKGSVSAKGQGQWKKGRRTGSSYKGARGGGEETSMTSLAVLPGAQPALSAEAARIVCWSKGAEGPISEFVPTTGPRWRHPGFTSCSSHSSG